MQVPSGRTFYEKDINLIKLMEKYHFIRYMDEPFLLNSEIPSRVYVPGREDVTDHTFFEKKIGEKICNSIWNAALDMGELRESCLIGIPTAGTTLAQAGAMASLGSSGAIFHRIMREKPKNHGAKDHQGWVNGRPDTDKHCYWLVDNVTTSGKSMIEAGQKLEDNGYPSITETPCLTFVDRQQGAVKRLQSAGFKKVVVVYHLLDLTFVLCELGLWPKNVVASVEEEIKAHQFI